MRASADESEKLLWRAEAAQRLQSCDRLRRYLVAARPSGVNLISDFRSAGLGDESVCHNDSCRVPNCAGHSMGFRDDTGRDEAYCGRLAGRVHSAME